MIDFNVSVDIETTGLNPWEDRAVTVALVGNQGDTVEVFDEPEDEQRLLQDVEGYMRHTKIDLLVGWNHTEFDLPFLAVRFVLNGVDLPPFIRPTGEVGKYGKPRYDGMWYGASFRDIAYDYQEEAMAAGVKWSLKPFAEYKKLGKGIEVDFERDVVTGKRPCQHDTDFGGNQHEHDLITRRFTILDLDTEQRKLYCASDAQLTMALFQGLPEGAKGQAVLLNGGLTIL